MGLREAQGFLKPLSLEAGIELAHVPFNSRLSHRLGCSAASSDNPSTPAPPRPACFGYVWIYPSIYEALEKWKTSYCSWVHCPVQIPDVFLLFQVALAELKKKKKTKQKRQTQKENICNNISLERSSYQKGIERAIVLMLHCL